MQRRRVLVALAAPVAGAAVSGCAPLASSHASSNASPNASPASESERQLRQLVLMRGALDDRLVVGTLTGTFNASIGDEVMPLFGFVSATFARYRLLADGTYRIVTVEQTYYTDLVGRDVLQTWSNPFTGKTVVVPVFKAEPSVVLLDRSLRFNLPKVAAGVSFEHGAQRVATLRGSIAFNETLDVRTAATATSRARHYYESILYRADAATLERRDALQVPVETSFTSIVSWRPWLEMGDHPGHMVGTGAGTGNVAPDRLPTVWGDATRRLRPALLDDPVGVLRGAWES